MIWLFCSALRVHAMARHWVECEEYTALCRKAQAETGPCPTCIVGVLAAPRLALRREPARADCAHAAVGLAASQRALDTLQCIAQGACGGLLYGQLAGLSDCTCLVHLLRRVWPHLLCRGCGVGQEVGELLQQVAVALEQLRHLCWFQMNLSMSFVVHRSGRVLRLLCTQRVKAMRGTASMRSAPPRRRW
jgi:hypothetical protein